MKQSVYVGIDVSSEKLDVYIDALDTWIVVPNQAQGWEELAQELIPLQPIRIVLEATGNYEKGVLKALLANVIRTAVDNALKPLMQEHLKALKARLKEIEGMITQEVKQRPALHAQVQLLCTTPGIGFLSAVALLTEIPELGSLTPKQITALAGLAPYVQQSGKYRGQARITGGRERARKSLYMPVVACLRCNEVLKEFYERLKGAGKPSKKALAACMRKLLCRLNAMVRDQQPWQIHATS